MIRRGQSRAADPRVATRELLGAIDQPDIALVVFFCSARYPLAELAAEIKLSFGATHVVGCTASGEIGPQGYLDHSITGMSFSSDSCAAVSAHVAGLEQFEPAAGHALAQDALRRLETLAPATGAGSTFGLLLIDGLSTREEPVTRSLQNALGPIPMVGGSAADDMQFRATHIYVDGAFHTDSAVLSLITTSLPFRTFRTQHVAATDVRLVATAADPARRLLIEIDGRPAAAAYAELVGTTVEGLTAARFAANPVVVVIGGRQYVRSMQKANADGSLSMLCAIEEGLVLRTARCGDILGGLQRTLSGIRSEIGPPSS